MYSKSGGGDGLSQSIAGTARVGTRVLRVRVHDVKSHEPEGVGLGEARSSLDGHVVVEPLHLHGGVGDRDQTALKVRALALLDGDVLDGRREHRGLLGGLLHVLATVHAGTVFQVLELLHVGLVLTGGQNLGRAWGSNGQVRRVTR